MNGRIKLTPVGGVGTEIELDGQRVEHAVRGLTVHAAVGQVVEVTLDVVLLDGLGVDVEGARVTVPDATRDVLIALGWTPPEG